MTIGDTDVVPGADEGGETQQFGFFARLVANDRIARLIELGQMAQLSHWRTLMGRLDSVETGLTNQATALGNLATQQAQLATQIGDLVAGSVSQADIDRLAAQAQANADAIQAAADAADASYEPDAGEGEPPTEPPVEPTP